MKYRKKPVVIDAVEWRGYPTDAMLAHLGAPVVFDSGSSKMVIETLEGTMYADIGDYIIKGVAGEFYPCKPDIFAATYEPAESVNAVAGHSE